MKLVFCLLFAGMITEASVLVVRGDRTVMGRHRAMEPGLSAATSKFA
ncbi:hypothetical protein SAMN04488072_104209 [Lentibacillus halodurans]|uniref:Uncharacterized protein n=1 Tax=Lentibacillus halodurans TaxID=237679 RepID=A0A1I0X8R1_9BACI|nr:hypothetical protein [Lentibacillus halodurans]SFA96730.1 hypothetical protein SAMN04488072_104209 [Lentibacillus halodurans]